jgi:hypothetical protein
MVGSDILLVWPFHLDDNLCQGSFLHWRVLSKGRSFPVFMNHFRT